MCRTSTELLFVFVCLFSACKIQASIYDLLVSFLYLKLHFIFALYLHLWHAILLKNFQNIHAAYILGSGYAASLAICFQFSKFVFV